MVTKKQVLDELPAFKNEVKLVTWRQSADRLMKEIIKAHERYEQDYDQIYGFFDTGEIYSTCDALWNFCKYNLPYNIESEEEQSVKSPAAILHAGQKVDCKHYSLFIGGVLGAIKANEAEPWDWCYRFACYDNSGIPEHVFVVVFNGNKEIWVDPVLTGFNQKKQPVSYIDKRVKSMAIYSISGIGDKLIDQIEVTDIDKAEANFFKMVQQNWFSMKDLLLSDRTILYGPVKTYFLKNGFDFNHLLVMLGI